jgi:hypothetical protein
MNIITLKKKKELFPEVEDFSKDFTKYHNYDPFTLGGRKWFFYHPSAYKLIWGAIPLVGLFQFSVFAYFSFIRANWFLFPVCVLICVYFVYLTFKIFKNMKYNNYTFYDFILKEKEY